MDTFIIGNKQRNLCEERELTQMEVVLVLGISYNHYAKIKKAMITYIRSCTEQVREKGKFPYTCYCWK